jgi:hypothetical protein
LAKIEPYGAEELREVMIQRKQAELSRLREERLRRQAYKDALDVKVCHLDGRNYCSEILEIFQPYTNFVSHAN